MMFALPAFTAVTRPEPEMVATAGSLELHVTVRLIGRPRRSFMVTLACVVWPTWMVLDARWT
jgi:hypothetical protein